MPAAQRRPVRPGQLHAPGARGHGRQPGRRAARARRLAQPGFIFSLAWSALRRQARARPARPPSRRGGPHSPAARGRYSWFAPDTSGSLFSWIGDTASLLNGNSLTSVGQLYTGAAAALINAQAEGQPFNLTGLGMSPTEARARAATLLQGCRRARPAQRQRPSESAELGAPAADPCARRAGQEASVHKALTEPLPAIKTDGVWSQQCAPCIGQGEEGVPDRNFTSAAQEVRRPCPRPPRLRVRASKGVPAGRRPAVPSACASRRQDLPWRARACGTAEHALPDARGTPRRCSGPARTAGARAEGAAAVRAGGLPPLLRQLRLPRRRHEGAALPVGRPAAAPELGGAGSGADGGAVRRLGAHIDMNQRTCAAARLCCQRTRRLRRRRGATRHRVLSTPPRGSAPDAARSLLQHPLCWVARRRSGLHPHATALDQAMCACAFKSAAPPPHGGPVRRSGACEGYLLTMGLRWAYRCCAAAPALCMSGADQQGLRPLLFFNDVAQQGAAMQAHASELHPGLHAWWQPQPILYLCYIVHVR